jgi:hypothetical protein
MIPIERIAEKIYLIRGEKVMLDSDLAALYGVETRVFNQAVNRNIERFPDDFMFQLTKEELENWRSQFVISNPELKMGLRRTPYVFTEHGALMVSSVLRSKQATEVSVLIVRAFVRIRDMLASHKDVALKVEEHDRQIANLYAHVERLLRPELTAKNPIGYIKK